MLARVNLAGWLILCKNIHSSNACRTTSRPTAAKSCLARPLLPWRQHAAAHRRTFDSSACFPFVDVTQRSAKQPHTGLPFSRFATSLDSARITACSVDSLSRGAAEEKSPTRPSDSTAGVTMEQILPCSTRSDSTGLPEELQQHILILATRCKPRSLCFR